MYFEGMKAINCGLAASGFKKKEKRAEGGRYRKHGDKRVR